MLTVKEINGVSFGKAGFSGYKPEDVDNFIDEVAASFQQLEAERDDALKRAGELAAQNSELSAKNAEIQAKLAILAQKIESYRADEDGIKDALLSAQRLAKNSVQEAKDKAEIILQDAQDSAKQIMDNAKIEASKAAKEYMAQADEKKEELEEMKRQVSAFRASLLEMYKKHLESINHIPTFKQKEKPEAPEEEPSESEEAAEPVRQEPVEQKPVPVEKPRQEPPAREERSEKEPVRPPEPVRKAAPLPPVRQQPSRKPAPDKAERPTLHDRVDYTREQLQTDTEEDDFLDDDLTSVGIDLKTYNNIPETLKQEKNSHFSNLEFGDDVDLGNKKRKK